MKTVTEPFNDYILFSNKAIVEVIFMNRKNLKKEGNNYYYHTTEIFKGKVKYRAIAMSDNRQELESYRDKISK